VAAPAEAVVLAASTAGHGPSDGGLGLGIGLWCPALQPMCVAAAERPGCWRPGWPRSSGPHDCRLRGALGVGTLRC
jgi:hypothetical protein